MPGKHAMSRPEPKAGPQAPPVGVHVFTDDDRIREAARSLPAARYVVTYSETAPDAIDEVREGRDVVAPEVGAAERATAAGAFRWRQDLGQKEPSPAGVADSLDLHCPPLLRTDSVPPVPAP